MQETFFEVFFSLTRLFLCTKDEVLKDKLVEKTKELFIHHLQGSTLRAEAKFPAGALARLEAPVDKLAKQEEHVAQCVPRILKMIDGLQELIEILIHLKLVDLSPALLAQKNLLRFQGEIIDLVSPKSKKTPPQGSTLRVDNFKYSSQAILDYLKTKPEGVQAIEIVHDFKTKLSRRTIQRYLNSLISEGLIKKDRVNGFPRYFPN